MVTKLVIILCALITILGGVQWYSDIPIVTTHLSSFIRDVELLLTWCYIYMLEEK